MAVIELSVKNFRAIQSETLKEIPPVAGIWGKNGCGKSAVLQSIVAIKNLAQVGYGPEPAPALNMNGLALGGLDTIIFKGRGPEKELSIEVKGERSARLGFFQLTDRVTIDVPDQSFPNSIRYFPTHRTITERSYALSNYSKESLALSPNVMHPYVHWFIHEKLYEKQQTGTANELDEVNRWLQGFGLGELSDQPLYGRQATVSSMFTDLTTGYGAPIIDGGFGGNSMLSILLEAYSFKNGILLIEEPEMSLHPGAQADLFDLFVTLAKNRGHQVIFTSHSEYLLRRFARYGKENPASTTIGAFHGRKDSSGAHFKRLSMADLVKRWEEKHEDMLLDLHTRPEFSGPLDKGDRGN